MSANFIKTFINYRLKYSLYTSFLGIIQYNSETGSFVPAPFKSRLNTTLISLIVFTVWTPMWIYFAWTERNQPDYTLFAGLMIGVVEQSTAMMSSALNIQFQLHCTAYCKLLDEHFRLMDSIKEHQQSNTQPTRGFQKFQRLLLFASITTLIFPFAFMPAICVPFESIHRLLLLFYEIDIKFDWHFWHIFYSYYCMVVDACDVVYVSIIGILLHLMLMPYAVQTFTPKEIASKTTVVENGRRRVVYDFATESQEMVSEERIILHYRYLQILNSRLNGIFGCLALSVHHAGTLISFSCLSFFVIKSWYILVGTGSGIVLLLGALIGMVATLFMEYVQAHSIGDLVDASRNFREKGDSLVPRTSLYAKFIMSCPDYMTLQSAHPFYSITKETFVEFLNKGFDFLVTLLTFQIL